MGRLPKENKAGLYLTVIAHLAVVIIALLAGLDISLRHENNFVLDFSEYEKVERLRQEKESLEKQLNMKEEISRKIERELAAGEPVRSIAVNRGELKDDRGTDAKKLYADAERLSRELAGGYEAPGDDEYAAEDKSASKDKGKENKPYSGPSVLDWYLEGRKASHLPIPAYRCMGAGEVKVLIGVDPQGKVIDAKIDESCSSKDGCLRSFAVRAARSSRFSKSATAPAKQSGYIIYQFIAQ